MHNMEGKVTHAYFYGLGEGISFQEAFHDNLPMAGDKPLTGPRD